MLNYQSTSYHDAATVRSLFGLRPAPEFLDWLEKRDILRNGQLTSTAGRPALLGNLDKELLG
jgi:ethanolamine ammonia-lyase large subunit